MKAFHSKVIFFLSCVVAPSIVFADAQFQPRVIAGIVDYEIAFDLSNLDEGIVIAPASGAEEQDFESVIQDEVPVAGLGGTVVFDNRWYLDAYFQTSVRRGSDERTPTQFQDVGDVEFERDDMAISLGRPFGRIAVFGGYRLGETRFSQFTALVDPPPDVFLAGLEKIETDFQEKGPFVGGSYSIDLGPGVLGVSVAVARLDLDVFQQGTRTRSDTKFKGDSTGYNVGVVWRAMLTDEIFYSVTVDGYRYDFDVDGEGISDRSVTEEALSGRIQIGTTFF